MDPYGKAFSICSITSSKLRLKSICTSTLSKLRLKVQLLYLSMLGLHRRGFYTVLGLHWCGFFTLCLECTDLESHSEGPNLTGGKRKLRRLRFGKINLTTPKNLVIELFLTPYTLVVLNLGLTYA